MGTKYSSQSATGYNSSPPSDDGSTTDANKVKWSTIKTKLADPPKNLADAINTALVTALDVSVGSTSTNYTTQASDHQKPILCTNSITISLCDAATAGVGYQATIVNVGTGTVTVGVITASDTLNGVANGSLTLNPWQAVTFCTNATPDGYVSINSSGVSAKVVSFFRDSSVASGTQAVTGVGFRPRVAVFIQGLSTNEVASVGFDDGSARGCIYKTVGSSWAVGTNAIVYSPGSGNFYVGDVQSFDDDGFTINWSKTGSPTGAPTVKALLFR